jgi:hypothetical protein
MSGIYISTLVIAISQSLPPSIFRITQIRHIKSVARKIDCAVMEGREAST